MSSTVLVDHDPVLRHASPGLGLYESRAYGPDGPLTVHTILIDPGIIDVTPLVNVSGQGYHWADCTVRGLVGYESWMDAYFKEVSAVFRQSSIDSYVSSFRSNTVNPVEMACDCNGNLFWNLGHWIFSGGKLYHHYRELIKGRQTALVSGKDGKMAIRTLDFDEAIPFAGLDYAISGVGLVRGGKAVDLAGIDDSLGRLALTEFVGDFSHLISVGFNPIVNLEIFKSNIEVLEGEVDMSRMSRYSRRIFESDCRNFLSKRAGKSDVFLQYLVKGEAVCIDCGSEFSSVRASLLAGGYREGPLDGQGTFCLDGSLLHLRAKRSRFGHSLISLSDQGQLLLTKVYTDHSRRGLTLEDTVSVSDSIAGNLGIVISDVMVASNGGDLRIHCLNGDSVIPVSESLDGEPLLFRGVDYGVSSALVMARR